MSGPFFYALTALAVFALLLIIVILERPSMTTRRFGKGLSFLAFFILPVLVTTLGTFGHLENSKTTQFCLSCHVMEPYGQSLMVDDPDYVAASHFQNNRISRDHACFTCHTTYTMFGDLQAKLNGLKHLYVYYLGTVPSHLELYQPYRNRECLSCHGGARSFEEDELHADLRAELASDEVSCMECHTPVHGVEDLDDLELWQGVER